MSIRQLARELYRLQREKERIEAEIAASPLKECEALEARLRKVRAEWQRMKSIMEGEKTPPPFRQIPTTLKPK